MRRAPALLCLLAAACGDGRSFDPGRSVEIEFRAGGLPDGGSAEYRVFVQDTVAVAHGTVANTEADTVRISSSEEVRAQWQDALVTIGQAGYIFAPDDREFFIEQSSNDTSVTVDGSFALASGGFILTISGVPAEAAGYWSVVTEDGALLTNDFVTGSGVVRRGDLPPGPARLELDTFRVELAGIEHYYTPPQRDTPLNLTASLDLIPVHAPYAIASVVMRVSPSGLPPGTFAFWSISSSSGAVGFSDGAVTGSVRIFDLLPPDDYTIEWQEVTVDGITYRADPAMESATLAPRVEPYEFVALYTAVP